ncbi:hypothetical protein ENBRE01_1832 [Enteropsectra breve]|nr:hypothetical protein ENBRE01_1832 [Enteropsectra breve]
MELVATNSENINRQSLKLLNDLFDSDISKFVNIKLLLSDGAKYALKAGRMLKELIPTMKHVTGICHVFHNFCETVRNDCDKINTMSLFIKRVLVKTRVNQDLYFDIFGKKFPKFPIIMRWGTWLKCAIHILDNFADISRFISNLSSITSGLAEIKSILVVRHSD